jgi:pantetheine-phosphate adenylyltransferase
MAASRRALFPGSFDPITMGHLDLITRSAHLFDHVVVAILRNQDKKAMFTLDERMAMIRESCGPLVAEGRVEVAAFEGLLVDFAQRVGASAIVRGLRSTTDFEYERPMTLMNAHLAPTIDTVFLLGAERYAHISSRLVKEVAHLGGDITGLVPDDVAAHMRARLRAGQAG